MTGEISLGRRLATLLVGKPGRAFFNVGSPSPVFVRLSTTLNGHPTFISGPLEIGRDYEFEVKLKARIPGRQSHACDGKRERRRSDCWSGILDEHFRQLG